MSAGFSVMVILWCCLPMLFRLLQLPGPHLNELNKAEWPVSSSELSKAYRKLSILVHPDKAPRPEARQAFEQLKQAYNELKDADKLVSCVVSVLSSHSHSFSSCLVEAYKAVTNRLFETVLSPYWLFGCSGDASCAGLS